MALLPFRRMGTVPLLICALLLVCAPNPSAAEIHVPGDFANLQDAIDAAGILDVIRVTGGVHPPIVIDKPLFLVGAASDRPRVRTSLPGEETVPFTQDPAVTLLSFGIGTVTMSFFDLGGQTDGVQYTHNAPTIAGGGYDEVRLLHCSVTAPEWIFPGGFAEAADAIELTFVSALLISDCTVLGGAGITNPTPTGPSPLPDGGYAVRASGTSVTVLDSIVRGGQGADEVYISSIYCPGSCDPISGGRGGIAILAESLFHAGSVISGGQGSTLLCQVSPTESNLICFKPAGSNISLSGPSVALPGTLLGAGPFVLGSTVTLTWSATSPTVFLAYSIAPIPPLDVGAKGLLFLHPDLLFLLPVPGGDPITIPFEIPALPELSGVPIGFQIYDPAVGLSRPSISAFVPW